MPSRRMLKKSSSQTIVFRFLKVGKMPSKR
nr:MAG TPA: hypothetical protein [Caudoviricetes sp.]